MATSVSTMQGVPTPDALASTWGGRDGTGKASSRMSGANRRRSIPHLLLGVLLVVACSVGGVLAGMRLGDRESVLALARPVAVGQVLAAQDLKQVNLAADSGMDAIPASAASTVAGQPVAFSLPAGSLLTRSALGSPQIPLQGKVIAALGLKSGQFPPDLTPGTTVLVLTTSPQGATTGTQNAQTSGWTAVVTGIASRETEQTTVVSLQLSELDARSLASAPAGQLSLVATSGGAR
ncbi:MULTISPECIES: SAF domain-containing protein [unclassified Crossiella]|uniref:SAF domain-containing protein n=1 Tax=unclassified Crossiella TaxID=2620835 RepID=UPI001FFF2F2E|nr:MULTISPECIES: SAF domain-containing protein [unclassified Crossiella]MCK2239760.1 SAF domain-containing protein [Crossiella sp. S99.2]MCK2252455.1 SAF domain-containing protein [Crossiella sp. S99.1]